MITTTATREAVARSSHQQFSHPKNKIANTDSTQPTIIRLTSKLPALLLLGMTMLFLGSCSSKSPAPEVSTQSDSIPEVSDQSDSTPEVNSHHDVSTAFSLAVSAVLACNNGEVQECNKVSRIESVLVDWCSQNDREACEALNKLEALSVSQPVR